MNRDGITAVATIIGSIAVFATLVYLAVQIRQTNDISRFSTAKDIMAKFDDLNSLVVTDSDLRRALHKDSSLSDDEQEQVYTYANMFCNTWVICQSAYDNGLIDKNFYVSAKRDVVIELQRWPKFRQFVNLWLERYPTFREWEVFSQIDEQ